MELKAYITPLIKNWWLILIACIISAVSSFFIIHQQPLVYQTRTTLVIGRAVYEPNPTGIDFWMTQQLASFYADLAQRQLIREATMEALGLEWLPNYIARPLPNNQLLEIVVTDSNPERAQVVANELARQLISQSPTSPQTEQQEHQAFINEQLLKLENEITETDKAIIDREEELAGLNSARQIADAQAKINALRSKLTTLQTNYATLIANSEQGATNTLTVIEQAPLPNVPVGPNTKMIVLLSTVIAGIIAAGAAYLIEYLDDTLKTPEEITRLLNLPILGYLSERVKEQIDPSYIAQKPRSDIAEAFRSLKINLDFVSVDKPLRTVLVSSPGVSDGKTSIAFNLALIIAQAEKKVALIDADLRKPSVHKFLDLPNQRGLTDVFRGSLDLNDVIIPWKEMNRLLIIPTGSLPPNPTVLLGSKKMDNILEALKQLVDIIIIDGPPFIVADAPVIAAKVDGVLLVIRHAFTRKGSAMATMEQLNRAGARVVGVALNRLPRAGEHYYGRSHYYNTYFDSADDVKNARGISNNGRSKYPIIFGNRKSQAPKLNAKDHESTQTYQDI